MHYVIQNEAERSEESQPETLRFALSDKINAYSNNKNGITHLKLILKNNPPEVQHFEISHGYNMLYVNHGWDLKSILLRIGAGVVIAHPENIVRDKRLFGKRGIFGSGYFIRGPAVHSGLGKRFLFFNHLLISVEGKLTAAYVEVPVVEGKAIVPHVGFHGMLGIGYRL